jgi:hypothetical protein
MKKYLYRLLANVSVEENKPITINFFKYEIVKKSEKSYTIYKNFYDDETKRINKIKLNQISTGIIDNSINHIQFHIFFDDESFREQYTIKLQEEVKKLAETYIEWYTNYIKNLKQNISDIEIKKDIS